MMKMLREKLWGIIGHTALLFLLANAVMAAEIIPRVKTSSGKVFLDVKWGPVNNGKVVVFHAHGVAFIPLEELPAEYQDQFRYKPPSVSKPPTPADAEPVPIPSSKPVPTPAPSPELPNPAPHPPSPPNSANSSPEWQAYTNDKNQKVVLEGKLVDKSSLTALTGFVVATGTLSQTGPEGHTRVPITTLELARKKNNVASALQKRPGLWKGTGEEVILLNYKHTGESGALLTLYVKETEPVDSSRAFIVAKEPTFEQWRAMRNR